MEFIETLTTKLGISIRTLASFLRIHHSLLARFDTAEKMLPRMALPEVIEIYALAEKVQPAADPLPNEQQKKELLQQAEWCNAQIWKLNKNLAAVQQRYQQGHTLLQVLAAYEEKFAEKIDDKRGRWIESQRGLAQLKMDENGWEAQWKIRVEIGRLEVEISYLSSTSIKTVQSSLLF